MKIAIVGFAAILAVGIGDAHAGSAARETLRALTQESA